MAVMVPVLVVAVMIAVMVALITPMVVMVEEVQWVLLVEFLVGWLQLL